MKYLDGKYYVEMKDQYYQIHPTENITVRELEIEKKIWKNQKVSKRGNYELEIKRIQNDKTSKKLKN